MQIKSQRRYRTFLIVLVYFIMVMMGITIGRSSDGMPREKGLFYSLMLALVLTKICILDCRIVVKPLLTSSYWLVFMLFGIAVPICIIWRRGIAGLGIVAAHYVGMILVQIISLIVTSLLVHGTILPGYSF